MEKVDYFTVQILQVGTSILKSIEPKFINCGTFKHKFTILVIIRNNCNDLLSQYLHFITGIMW